jgi:enoyl-CoA hydratase/carnithine racemase
MSEAPVLARVENGLGRLTLNRPKALHALNTDMCLLMTQALLAWRDDPAVRAVMIDHAGERGFCAGGDIRMLAESGKGDGAEARAFFLAEYRLNHLLFVYPKPVVAVMDGITMGGGVGISAPAKIRIATERTVFAMPETGIGLFPDVGGGWWLPRLPGESGLWLALTGARLDAAECLNLGLATHFVSTDRLDAFKAELVDDPEGAFGLPELFAGQAGEARVAGSRAEIDRLFAHDSMEAIFAALEADGGEWAGKELKRLRTKSPQSMKVTLRQLRAGGRMTDFAEVMAMEYRLAQRVVRTPDFHEGVRAVIVDKDNAPRWSPPTLEGVSEAELDALFAPLDEAAEWTPLA